MVVASSRAPGEDRSVQAKAMLSFKSSHCISGASNVILPWQAATASLTPCGASIKSASMLLQYANVVTLECWAASSGAGAAM